MTMPFDDATRLAAEAFGVQVGRAVQEHVQEFLARINDAAAQDRAALADQAKQAVHDAERTLQDAVTRARDEATREAESRAEASTRDAAAKLDESRDAVAKLEASTRENTSRLEERLEELTRRANYLESELASSQTREAQLQTREAELLERAARLDADLADRNGRFDAELTDRAASLKAELSDRAGRLEADLAARTERLEAVETELADRNRKLEAIDADVAARTLQLQSELAASTGKLEAVEAEVAARTSQLESDLAERTRKLEALEAEMATRMSQLEATLTERTERAGRLEAELADRSAQLERLVAERAAESETDLVGELRQERESRINSMESLVSAFRKLDEGQSLSQLLDVLAGQVAQQASRSAVFVVRGLTPQPGPQRNASLQGWAFSGFNGAPLDARSLSVPLDKLPALAEVVRQGGRSNVQTSGFAAADVNPLAFMSLPRLHTGMAVPVLVGGQVAAVVYGDDGASDQERASQSGAAIWPESLELLARHAARCLEAQTAIRAARLSASAPPAPVVQPVLVAVPLPAKNNGASDSASADGDSGGESYAEEHARRYARLLISDIRLYNEAAVRAGREHRDLWHRLQPDIARARRSFEDRVSDVPDRERLFDEELIRTLADGDEGLLGFELRRPAQAPERLAV